MGKLKAVYVVVGFIAGIVYILSCSGGGGSGGVAESIANTVINAIDVVYDNTTSKLSSTNVQAAIDELNDLIQTLQGDHSFQKKIVGTWNFKRVYTDTTVQLTINADGTYSSADGFDGGGCTAGGYTLVSDLLALQCSGDNNRTYKIVIDSNGLLYLAYTGNQLFKQQ